ncbi:CPBP family intramembrane glutamic endopeptidase [Marinimicrobium sp. ABcell2]|uniref:CPBP family intramembrane glutamic endopeptidase n=1 Tax=Marinimicrobium sp. ABcell2 TaxID=3069751 RepID=UPI0027B5A50B|nr:CPBP family intramembrane glutamic endopeptidase [Marinimicrobium sp. ABcell2]MDQ2075826.1 CPBP family intramembrane glutamic endopeptidase [Marinimicrobium sp. ABcell2]
MAETTLHNSDQHSLFLSIFLHLFPGAVLLAALLLLGPYFVAQGLPVLLAVVVIDAIIVVPIMLGILWYAKRSSVTDKSRPVVDFREKIKWQWFLCFSLLTLLWAVLAFVTLAPLAELLRAQVFAWVPSWFDLGNYALNPDEYRPGSVVATWFLAFAITSITVPVVEELYFRGYLLPRIDRYGAWAPFMNVVLFSIYHLWSLWLVPTRIIALLPLVYVVWLKRSIYIAIFVHVALNVVGDSLLTIPLVFG